MVIIGRRISFERFFFQLTMYPCGKHEQIKQSVYLQVILVGKEEERERAYHFLVQGCQTKAHHHDLVQRCPESADHDGPCARMAGISDHHDLVQIMAVMWAAS